MRFVYVDRIQKYEKDKCIVGFKNVTRTEALFYWLPNGQRVLSPAVVSESMAQLGAWLTIASNDFQKRPVLLADEHTEYFHPVESGSVLRMEVEVVDTDLDVVVTKGRAYLDDKLVAESRCTRGYLLPSSDFQDPQQLERSFFQIYQTDFVPLNNSEFLTYPGVKALAGSYALDGLRYVDRILKHELHKSCTTLKYVSSAENFFEEHFPRRPVVPGVILLSFVGETAQYLVKKEIDGPLRSKALIPKFIRNVRFRKFVSPGDVCRTEVKLLEGDPRQDASLVIVSAMIFVGSARVMQAEMGFIVMNGKDSLARL